MVLRIVMAFVADEYGTAMWITIGDSFYTGIKPWNTMTS
jgi:hypothetical protein